MVFENYPTPVPAPERTHSPPAVVRKGILWLPALPGHRWPQVEVREMRGAPGWVRVDGGIMPPRVPEVGSLHEVDLAAPWFRNGFVVIL